MNYVFKLLMFVFVSLFVDINKSDAGIEIVEFKIKYKKINKIKLDEDFIAGSVWSFFYDNGEVNSYYFKKNNMYKVKRLRYYSKEYDKFYTLKNSKGNGTIESRWTIDDNTLVISPNNGYAKYYLKLDTEKNGMIGVFKNIKGTVYKVLAKLNKLKEQEVIFQNDLSKYKLPQSKAVTKYFNESKKIKLKFSDISKRNKLNKKLLASLSEISLCYNATTWWTGWSKKVIGGKSYNSKFGYHKLWSMNENFVNAAKILGLKCGVGIYTNKKAKTIDPSVRLLASLSDTSVCHNATTTLSNKKVWNDININFVDEANYRDLDCDVNKPSRIKVVSKKPIITKPSSSSQELEQEKQKRIALQRKADEEERKRKELEKKIEELEKKNKELSKPKKKEPIKPSANSGSGFFISKLGHIITNEHVVNNCSKITVGDNIDRQVPAKLMEVDKKNDLALLRTTTLELASSDTKSLIKKLSTQNLRMEIVPLATVGLMRSNDVELGENIVVAGFPYGDIFSKDIKVTFGNVNSTKGVGDNSSQFQIQAPVQTGNSGGPIYDKYGNIVGVVVAQLDKLKMAKTIGSLPENVNFGIKASTVKQFLNSSGLPTKWAERDKPMSNKEISKIASKQTVMVVCHN